jgi:hypothetical protein
MSITTLLADITYIRAFPGAEFYGDPAAEDLYYAADLQRIRSEFEADGFEEMLWYDAQKMGFSPSDIQRFVSHPAAITSCGYGIPY